ncbi:LacI family DNA-binding transcriptional regulator [Flammeovirga kamogawensis]|uniref:LacI family transcriptional regulator n=1 Tax=Flammeovirga kamogawensis TaxID=373891 RepID=A0ABX8GYG0_9BACT|nr:LacI family DNA-binding transcriptional regulator [Flammeovirga kamogawensis]MBB6462888.1 LacI family transcriptional regulator [Flammeovirga kamogawensis]QWG08331.1 LacI family transcriptional regulator [Flammeovirga kamogawensis]TRX66627.1 LacI family transcriptional regulator [Flammeovirga kamogawensis]
MRKEQYTMQDIANELGISKSTVSRALKNHPDISQDTKDAVNKLAKEKDYQPNSLALSLRHNKSFVLGIIVPEIVHDFFANVISGVQTVAYNEGYNVMICISNESTEQEIVDAKAMYSSRVDGLLISTTKKTTDLSHLKSLVRKGVPLVMFDRVSDELDVSKVITDDHHGAYLATEHLIKQGCKKIVHLSGPDNLAIGINRKEGYKAALKDYKIAIDDNLIIPCPLGDLSEAREVTKQLLDSDLSFDAIFANNDVTAIGAMSSIKNKGLRIPEDISIVGFGDWRLSKLLEPPLSSIEQSGIDIGIQAATLLLEQIKAEEKDKEFKPRTEIIKSKLIKRESSTQR